MSVNFNSKEDLIDYVRTAEYQAGRALGSRLSDEFSNLEQPREESDWARAGIRPIYSPIILNYAPISWNFGTVHHYAPANAASSEEERDNRAACIGTVVTIGGAFLSGLALKNLIRTHQTKAVTEELKSKLAEEPVQNYSAKLNRIVSSMHEINKTNYSKSLKYTIAAIAIFAGGAFLAIGGFASIPFLITTGSITIVAGAAFAAITLAWHWSDGDDFAKSYRFIQTEASPLIRMIRASIETDRPPQYVPSSEPPPPYNPLFLAPSAPEDFRAEKGV